ncbi:cytochrome c oxidase subunit Va, partial [Teladorsagia circumcincta]
TAAIRYAWQNAKEVLPYSSAGCAKVCCVEKGGRPHQTEHCMASQLVRSVARATLSRGNVVRALSTTNALSAKDNVMEKWPAERFDKHFIDYLSRPEIDGWEVRKALTELHDYDVIPDPKVVEAALRACRRVNDLALCVRFLEAIKIKCGSKKNREVVYGYIINEVCPPLLT